MGGATSSNGAGGSAVAGSGDFGSGGNGPAGVCGDGIVSGFESCDDGNLIAGDGCDASCGIEPGWTCPSPGQACRQPRCGDGFQDSAFLGDSGSGGASGAVTNGGAFPVAGANTASGGVGPASGGVANTGGSASYYFEACDDGNTVDGDGCSATCNIEPGWQCSTPGVACYQPACGDGRVDVIFTPDSGGSSFGGAASGNGTGGATGGTWIFDQCDDGNKLSGDGCDASCQLESGFVCENPGLACRQVRCGDGIVDFIPGASGGAFGSGGTSSAGAPGATAGNVGVAGGFSGSGGSGGGGAFEECDDGNLVPGDGCTASCELEPGWSCATGTCRLAVCGDGITDYPLEQCDDGNNVDTDGCSHCTYVWGGGASSGGAPGFGGASGR